MAPVEKGWQRCSIETGLIACLRDWFGTVHLDPFAGVRGERQTVVSESERGGPAVFRKV